MNSLVKGTDDAEEGGAIGIGDSRLEIEILLEMCNSFSVQDGRGELVKSIMAYFAGNMGGRAERREMVLFHVRKETRCCGVV